MTGVYKIENIKTRECYIGSSKDVERRFAQHKCKSNMKRMPNNLLYKSIQKYGLENFNFVLLEECEPERLKKAEQYWIEKLNPAFNTYKAFKSKEEYAQQNREHSVDFYKRNPELNREKSRRWREKHLEENRRRSREACRRRRERQKQEAINKKN